MHRLIIQKKKIRAYLLKQKQREGKKNKRCIENDEADGYQTAKRVCCYEVYELKNKTNFKFENEAVYNTNLAEIDLWYITEAYDNLENWKLIGKYLGLTEQELLIIETRHLIKDSVKECFYQMLLKWRVKEPENCYYEYLCQKFQLEASFMKRIQEVKSCNYSQLETRFERYFNRYFSQHDVYCKLKEVKLSEKNLWHASGYLFQEWKSIARYLAIPENDVCLIDSKYYLKDGVRECCYQMLVKWRELYPNDCSLFSLCLKLIKLNLNLYVCQLLEYFSQNNSLIGISRGQ